MSVGMWHMLDQRMDQWIDPYQYSEHYPELLLLDQFVHQSGQ